MKWIRIPEKELALRGSAAEYLTFAASTGGSDESFEMRYEDENSWLTQKMTAALYDVDVRTESTLRKYMTTTNCRRRQLSGISAYLCGLQSGCRIFHPQHESRIAGAIRYYCCHRQCGGQSKRVHAPAL